RYATAEALAEDLERFLRGEPVRARRPGAAEQTWRWCRRNPALAALTGSVVLLLVAVAVVSSLSAWRLRREEAATRAQLGQTQQAERQARRHLFDAKLTEARASRWSRQVGQRFGSRDALAEAVELARELGLGEERLRELRTEAAVCLTLADLRPVKASWQGSPPGSSAGLAFDADLARYARSDLRGNVSVRRVEDDALLAELPGRGPGGAGSG